MKSMWVHQTLGLSGNQDVNGKELKSSSNIGRASATSTHAGSVPQSPLFQTSTVCKHNELISYKVHKDQFKSLLVPPSKSYKDEFLNQKEKALKR